jgi:5'-3' exonuclease
MKAQNLTKINYPKGLNYTTQRDTLLLPKRRHEPGSPCCLVIDGMNIAYQAFYAYAKLSYSGKSTSILYGFMNILRPIIQQYSPEKVVVCWDGKKHEARMKKLPTYKSHREKGRDPKQRKKFIKQIERTRRLLHYLGIPQAHNENIEGDDMIYLVTKRLQCLNKVIIVSGDKDFKQLINHDVSVYNPRTKYIENLWAFPAANYGLEVHQYKDYLCLVGDSSDDIPGVKNIGEKRAASLLMKFFTVKQYLESNLDHLGFQDKESLKKVYLRNNMMINLPYFNRKFNKGAKITYYKKLSQHQFNEAKFKAYCLKWGLKTSIYPKFLEPFIKLGS